MSRSKRQMTRRQLLAGGTSAAGLAALSARTGRAAPFFLNAATKTKLRVVRIGSTSDAKATQDLVKGFSQAQPDIEVQVDAIEAPDWDVFFEKLLTQIAAGQIPDMVFVATEGTQLFAGKGLASPLDDYVKRDKAELHEYFQDVAPSLVEAMFYEGSIYELPTSYNAANIMYSTSKFQQRGVPLPTDDWTVDEFRAAMPKLITQKNGQTTEYGFFWVNRMWGGAFPWIFVNGSNILTEARAPGGDWFWNEFYPGNTSTQARGGGWRWQHSQANNAANVEALTFLVDLTNEMKAAPEPVGSEAQLEVVSAFGAGQVASFIGGGFRVAAMKAAGLTPDEWDITYTPKWKTNRQQFGSVGYVITKQSQHKDAAWELAKYLTRKDVISAAVAGGRDSPARRSVAGPSLYTPDLGPKRWHVIYDSVDKVDSGPIPQPPQANQVTTIFTKYIGLAMTQDLKPQAALDKMHDELSALMAKPL